MDNDNKTSFIVTEEMIADRATDYVPVAEKQRFVDDVVVRCFDPLTVAGVSGVEEMPPMYKENSFRRNKYLAGALVMLYLGEDFSPVSDDDPWMMTDEFYDFFSSAKPIAQIERIRRTSKDNAIKDKCFNLISDYKELRDLLNSEIHGLMKAMNDTLSRYQMMTAAQVTPEFVEKLLGDAKSLQSMLDTYADQRQKGADAS